LDKKVKKNPKYENVKSVVSTGKTMKDVEIMSTRVFNKKFRRSVGGKEKG